MYTAELDISHEMPEVEVKAFAIEYSCEAELVEEFGPAGGNPVYKFSCEEYQPLSKLVAEVLWGNEDLVKECIVQS